MRIQVKASALCLMLALVACTHTQDLDIPDSAQDAIAFDVYTRGTVETKAGFTGDIDEASFKVAGFGVYAYVSETPDYMRNQHVTYSGGNWVYSPVKYWPNTNTSTISFYAYAPYVADAPYTSAEAAVTNADNKDGILYIPGPNDTGDPKIVYHTAADPSNNVDLMFGVAAEAHTSPDVEAGKPFLNMTKLKIGEKMKYNFKHALTKLAVNVDGYFDEVNSGTAGNNDVDANTRIVIESVTLSANKLAMTGTLNLNNTTANTPKWTPGAALSNYSLPIASNLTFVGGNDDSVVHFSQQPLGVTKTAQSLMGYGVDGTTAASLMFVPNADGTDGLDVTIVYHVITRDARLENGFNDVTNTITKNIASLGANAFQPGYLTTLNLHLGLASVTFDANVSDWTGGDTQNADLPKNYPYNISFISDTPLPMSLWKHGGDKNLTAQVFESGIDQTDNGFTFDWQSSNDAVATVISTTKDAYISPQGVGEATITLTVEKGGISQSASFNLFVDAISAVSLTASRDRVDIDQSSSLTASITFEGGVHGSIASLPFTLLSVIPEAETYLSISSSTTTLTEVTVCLTGVAYGANTLTATIPAAYTSSGSAALSESISILCTKVYSYSVASGRKVEIAPSNLMYQGKGDGTGTGTWSLMDNPWTIIETTDVAENYNHSLTSTERVSLFAWGTSGLPGEGWGPKYPWETSNVLGYGPSGANLPTDCDWGANSIDGLSGTGWRIPTQSEWAFLAGMSTGSEEKRGNQFGFGKIGAVSGLFFLPDIGDWTDPQPNSKEFSRGSKESFNNNNYTEEEWAVLSGAGAVFLPAAGQRKNNTETASHNCVVYSHSNTFGLYWSSTAWANGAENSLFLEFGYNPSYSGARYHAVTYSGMRRNIGLSVRLIREVE